MSSTSTQQPPLDVADHVDDLGDPRALAALIDDRQPDVKPLGDAARAADAADVGRDDDQLVRVVALA